MNSDLAKRTRALLARLEWSAIYSYYTGWACCPACRGIKPGHGYDRDTDSYPDSSGHRAACELHRLLVECSTPEPYIDPEKEDAAQKWLLKTGLGDVRERLRQEL
jgi:hypothetical protein